MTMHNPPHAGEIISDIMADLDIGIRELARALAIAPSTASRMVSGATARKMDQSLSAVTRTV